ncbi:ribosomal protein S18-alanine N-acetyltransferase [Nocardia pseudobrasiliensis]|uniref:Ribosomal-protein-alanine N-acetyltransferase n=1 Tax=Nocardia pseudobrasiliensis TaxID=45979 RepID=A0A370I509_9NOCA|nr:ribosomal protein S18-alanine N-acetyltransferase [Nocardia pseudobrasiliensis]RDI64424.1 ribosomal-protein-alanine N-acetyltransferase [Nocardia pseudobrasiliensis]
MNGQIRPGIHIEPMGPADIARCVELEKVLFPEDDPWPEVAFTSELAGAHNRYLVARDDESGRMLGYAGVALLGTMEHPEAEVHTIGVDPQCHRSGVGTLLLRALLAEAGRRGGPVFLEVRTDNAAAIALYQKHGFHIIGLRKNYYQPSGADAFTMRRPAMSGFPRPDAGVGQDTEVLS